MIFDLAFIWAGVIAFSVLTYVILDGFDLGIGILFPFLRKKEDKDLAMNTVAPVWDGNETWLVLGGGGLYAVFPLAYGVVLTALYVPMIAMLIGLIFRGVAFEFRWRTEKGQYLWDWSFFGGSIMAAFAQGVALGALVQGIEISDRLYAGGNFDWLTPFSMLTGVAVVVGYALMGSTWLILKTTGAVRDLAYRFSWRLSFGVWLTLGLVTAITPFLNPEYFTRWFTWPTILFSVIMPILLLFASYMFYSGLKSRNDLTPFLATLVLFTLGFIGIGISFYPYIVPPTLTIWQAAAPDSSLAFIGWGALFLIPTILTYSAYSYWVFRGKVEPGEGYH